MNKIAKLLAQLEPKQREKILAAALKVRHQNFTDLDITKLQNRGYIYRVRVGKYRIIFRRTTAGVELLDIARRSDNTYR